MNKKIFAFGLSILLILGAIGWSLTRHAVSESPKLLVLMYHHLTEEKEAVNPYTILVSDFEADLNYLKSHGYQTITPSQFLSHFENQTPLPEHPVMITFDDGYESVYAYAYPLLKQYHMNACVAVVGEYVDSYTQAEDHTLSYSYLTWSEVKELQTSGVIEVGNHSNHFHIQTDARTGCLKNPSESVEAYRSALTEDIGTLQDKIQQTTGIRPVFFAYPYGFYSEESFEPLISLGIHIAFTCQESWNLIPQHSNSFVLLNRFNRSGNVATEKFFQRIRCV